MSETIRIVKNASSVSLAEMQAGYKLGDDIPRPKKCKRDDDDLDWPERFWMEEGHNLPGSGYGGFFA